MHPHHWNISVVDKKILVTLLLLCYLAKSEKLNVPVRSHSVHTVPYSSFHVFEIIDIQIFTEYTAPYCTVIR